MHVIEIVDKEACETLLGIKVEVHIASQQCVVLTVLYHAVYIK